MPHRAGSVATGGVLAVTYDRAAFERSSGAFVRSEQSAGGTLLQAFDFSHVGKIVRVIAVSPSQSNAAMRALRAQQGVLDVAPTGQHRFALTVTQPLTVSNHYFKGFPGTSAPYYETASIPGQWDMHAIQLEYAFAYSQSSNGSGVSSTNALGSHGVKLALIDTGQDTLHPDLQANVLYQHCFITDPSSVQSSSSYSTDADGHGTDVAGIAAAQTDPSSPPATSLGFAGAGGNTGIYAYRVFPTPDDNCATGTNTNDSRCQADTRDIAAAIQDAVHQGVNVISLSLGGGGCTNGVDGDPVEGSAIADALAANVVVVAASGNAGGSGVSAPACDSGVIAVGATSLDDGQRNGSGHTGGSASSPVEYVASYSQYGSPAASAKSASAWGIVAPGGDPSSNTDSDDLHWIEHIWTSTPFDSNFAGECTDDYPASSAPVEPVDCRTLIAGTSMATPHVAGVAALVLAVNRAYQSPAAMKSLLCTTADDIGDPHEGCGRVNAYRAVAKALGDPTLP
jgi:subtilisin family serine protease